jgi:hypothetical protein
MSQQERQRPDSPGSGIPSPAGPGGANLNAIRQRTGDMLNTADQAINFALSGDSEAFNASVIQTPAQ